MKKHNLKLVAASFLVLLMFYTFGCILNPKEDIKPDPIPPPEFKDRTEREHVIENMELSYQVTDLEHYKELLHMDYIWHMQEGSDPEFLSRDQDINATKGIFDSKKFGHPDENKRIERLELQIYDGRWDSLHSIEGEPCSDCWYSERVYDITIDVASGTTIHGYDRVDFYIVGADEGGKRKYKIIRADDVELPTGGIR